MTELFFVRAQLRRDVSAAALAPLLVPQDQGAQASATHRLLWSLFADEPGRRRDFLWRQTGPGTFLALSARPPVDPHNLFILDWKPFAPVLRVDQRLAFSLRVNPVVAAKSAVSTQRGKRSDVVMHAIHSLPKGQRAAEREVRARTAVIAWMARQGTTHGFDVASDSLTIDGYEQVRIPRPGRRPIAFSVMDIEGVLMVLNPTLFLRRVAAGFGAARAFGCGLMLIRRAAMRRSLE